MHLNKSKQKHCSPFIIILPSPKVPCSFLIPSDSIWHFDEPIQVLIEPSLLPSNALRSGLVTSLLSAVTNMQVVSLDPGYSFSKRSIGTTFGGVVKGDWGQIRKHVEIFGHVLVMVLEMEKTWKLLYLMHIVKC